MSDMQDTCTLLIAVGEIDVAIVNVDGQALTSYAREAWDRLVDNVSYSADGLTQGLWMWRGEPEIEFTGKHSDCTIMHFDTSLWRRVAEFPLLTDLRVEYDKRTDVEYLHPYAGGVL